MPAPTWMWQLPCPTVCLQRLFEERTLASQVLFQWEQAIHCSNGQPIKSTHGQCGQMEGKEGWSHRSPHWGTTMWGDFSRWCSCTPHTMRHTQLFTYLLLLAKRNDLTLTQSWHWISRMFYHCVFSDTYILIALTKQVTQLALMQVTLGSLPTMVPVYPSLDHFMGLSSGSLVPQCTTPPDKLLLVCGRYP